MSKPRLAHAVTIASCECGATILFKDESGEAWGEAHISPWAVRDMLDRVILDHAKPVDGARAH